MNFEFLTNFKLRICGNPISSENFETLLKRISKLPNLNRAMIRARRIKSFPARIQSIQRTIEEMKVFTKDIIV